MSNIVLDQKDIWTSRSDTKSWLLVGAGTAALIATDDTISKQLPDFRTSVSAGTDISRAGQVYSVYPFVGCTRCASVNCRKSIGPAATVANNQALQTNSCSSAAFKQSGQLSDFQFVCQTAAPKNGK
jgi:hypothetical protein